MESTDGPIFKNKLSKGVKKKSFEVWEKREDEDELKNSFRSWKADVMGGLKKDKAFWPVWWGCKSIFLCRWGAWDFRATFFWILTNWFFFLINVVSNIYL